MRPGRLPALWARLGAMRGWRADVAAAGFGGLSALALPPVHALPVLLIAVPALLHLLDGTPGPAVAARRGFFFGLAHHILGLYWITEAILFEAARFWWLVPFAVPALAAVLALFIAAATGVARLAPAGLGRVLALAGAWVLADLAREFVATGFPWDPWGGDWSIPGPLGTMMMQPAAWIGVDGLTLLTLLLAATPYFGRRGMRTCVAGLVLWMIAGTLRTTLEIPPAPSGPPVQVVLVQGNVPQGQKWSPDLARGIWERYLTLTRQGVAAAGPGTPVVVWPETASPVFPLEQIGPGRDAILAAAGIGPDRPGAALIGSVGFTPSGRPRNSLVAFGPGGRVRDVYDKWHLVPFGEFQPDWFPLPIQVVPGGGFAPGSGPTTIHLPGVPPVGPMICYEAIYSGEMVNEADRPAWLVNVTNDAWFGNSSGPRQHLAQARMRAVEEGLPLLRAANTGISAVFDGFGHEMARLGLGKTGYLVVSLPPALPRTLFARGGLAIPGALALIVLALGFRVCHLKRLFSSS